MPHPSKASHARYNMFGMLRQEITQQPVVQNHMLVSDAVKDAFVVFQWRPLFLLSMRYALPVSPCNAMHLQVFVGVGF
jgi:hypothetical protein